MDSRTIVAVILAVVTIVIVQRELRFRRLLQEEAVFIGVVAGNWVRVRRSEPIAADSSIERDRAPGVQAGG